jgi:hypothetical protein
MASTDEDLLDDPEETGNEDEKEPDDLDETDD